jgi:hypothetical protein
LLIHAFSSHPEFVQEVILTSPALPRIIIEHLQGAFTEITTGCSPSDIMIAQIESNMGILANLAASENGRSAIISNVGADQVALFMINYLHRLHQLRKSYPKELYFAALQNLMIEPALGAHMMNAGLMEAAVRYVAAEQDKASQLHCFRALQCVVKQSECPSAGD